MKIKFNIDRNGCLYSFSSTDDHCEVIEEFIIPSKIKGREVSSIGELEHSFSKLKDHGVKRIKKIKIEDGIREVQDWAFANIEIEIDELHWPVSCENISPCCFDNTPLKAIKGIEHVKGIGDFAFARTNLKTITWPSDCEKIPKRCFFNTPLEGIKGIEHVKKIGICAFARTNLKTITWPSDCEKIPYNCFENSSLEEIIFSNYRGIKDIDLYNLYSFIYLSGNNIKKIDLSSADAVNLIRGHSDVDYKKLYERMKGLLRLPYYVNGLE